MTMDWQREFRYDQWATGVLLDYMLKQPSLPNRSRQLLAHLLAAAEIWLNRLEGEPRHFEVWPDDSLPACAVRRQHLVERFGRYLANLSAAEAARVVTYKNTKGESFQNAAADILRHVLFHGMYHRGQIATHLRQAGLEPPATDFIFAVREGRLG